MKDRKEYNKTYGETHKNEISNNKKIYYRTHQEQVKNKNKRYYEREKEKLLKYQNIYYAIHKDNKKDYDKQYRKTHKAEKLLSDNRRRIRKLSLGGLHTVGEWENLKAQYNWTCPACKKMEPEVNLTRDHIVPLVKGGSDNIENIQPLCRKCNASKYTEIIKYDYCKS